MNEKKGQVKKDLYQIIDIIQEDNMKLKIMNKKSKIHEYISQHLEQNVFLTWHKCANSSKTSME